jgi:nucleoside diphosphate kinase
MLDQKLKELDLQITNARICKPNQELVRKHYASSEKELFDLGQRNIAAKKTKGIVVKESEIEIANRIVGYNVQALTSGRVLAMVIEGLDAISKVRTMVGPTEPAGAKVRAPESLRAIFCEDSFEDAENRPLENGFHASDSLESAKREIDLWFGDLKKE